MTIYALDSNTVSYFLRGEGSVRNYFKHEIIENGNLYAIPLEVFYEVRRWLLYKPTKITRKFAQEFDILFQNVRDSAEMPIEVYEQATEIYIALKARGQLIADPDIFIAAYCLVNDCTLVTRNADDFSRIDGLNHVNWFD
jgi:tRNA(fMet)-specific endonuclease VapC